MSSKREKNFTMHAEIVNFIGGDCNFCFLNWHGHFSMY